jgi:hypothetical protein
MASFDTFMALRDYVKGKISGYELADSDPNISRVKSDNSNLGQSIVTLEFEDDNKFWELTDLSDDDIWFIRAIGSYYSDYEFLDSYSVDEDFKGGYIIFNDLTQENVEKLEKIAKVIYPLKFDLGSEDFKSGLAAKLLSTFKKQTRDILDDYQIEKNSEMNKVAEETIEKDLKKYFEEYGLTYVAEGRLTTTVANLIMWYIRTNSLHQSIAELLPKVFSSDRNSMGGWYENTYEFQNDEYFDSESFNNYVGRMLDVIWEKIEDGALSDEDYNIEDYIKMVDRLSSKFKVDTWYSLPKKKDVRFKIVNFEMNPDRVVVKLSKEMKQRDLKLSEENFNYLLYQPTLFNLEEI